MPCVNAQLSPRAPWEAWLINVYEVLRDPCKKQNVVISGAVARGEDGLLIIKPAPRKRRTTVPWETGRAVWLECKDRCVCCDDLLIYWPGARDSPAQE